VEESPFERGQRETEGEGVNRGVSRVADVEAKLTAATNMARAQRQRQNRCATTADGAVRL
jgi:hypothetical protein